jgi:dihydroorotase-like cyclic amidohydrolase
MKTLITNGNVYRNGAFSVADVLIENDLIARRWGRASPRRPM